MRRTRAAVALVGSALIALAASISGAAAPPGPDNSPHVLIVPATPAAEAALGASSARVVAHYRSFTLVEAAGADYVRLRRAGADKRDDMQQVGLAGGSLDPAARPPLVAKGHSPRGRRAGLALVQFVGPVKQAWLDELRRTGVRVAAYVPENGYLVHGNGAALARAGALAGSDPAVRAVTSVAPQDKLSPELPRAGTTAVEVQTLSGSDGAAARQAADGAGRELRGRASVDGVRTQFLRLDAAALERLAADPGVVAIAPYHSPRLLDERAAQIVAGNLSGSSPSGPGYLGWLTSAPRSFSGPFDFGIDVTDEGLDTGSVPAANDGSHPDFYVNGDASGQTRVAYENNYTPDPDARDCGGHGTNVASIAAGYNNQTVSSANSYGDSAGYRYGLGIAPFAKIGASKVFRCSDGFFDIGASTLTDIATAAYSGGARISNNSWGSGPGSGYDSDAQEMDQIVRSLGMVEVVAAGNNGDGDAASTVGSPGTAKNVITVGASENVRPGFTDGCDVTSSQADSAKDIAPFSSRGPTDDNRMKPDVVAPGTHVTGASPQNASFPSATNRGTCDPLFPAGNTLYSIVSGTSQATPEVTGAAALIRDWYTRAEGAAPSPAMTKAVLVNTATDLVGGSDGANGANTNVPTPDQGWGRVNLGTAFDSATRSYRDQRPGDVIQNSGDTRQQVYDVQDGAKPVKVTLVWTDPAPATLGGHPWVNDLDLEVDAGGRTYKGNVFANGVSVTGGSADPRDNVENVYLPAGVSGTIAVRVRGTTIVGDGSPGNADSTDQDYALVVSNATPDTKPVLVDSSTSSIDDATGGDGDGVVEPGESFKFTETLENSGSAAATGLTGKLTGSDLVFGNDTSAYADIAAGASGSGSTPFDVSLGGSATCGRNVTMTLGITGDSGFAANVPVTIPTGSAGAPAGYTLSPNVAIPDDTVKGISSVIHVPDAGVVKDLEVGLTSLTHSFDGDLRITLTSPSGTTVTLADRPGGPANGGNNFTNTVFSDSAAQPLSSGSAPYTGSFRPPTDQLSRFDGESQQGDWTLRVQDLSPYDTGTLKTWGLSIRSATCAVGGGTPPTASFTASPDPVQPGQAVAFDSSGSSAPGSTIATRGWDTNGDGQFDDGSGVTATRTFSGHGLRTVRLYVKAANGLTDVTSRTILVNTPPTASFTVSPSSVATGQAVKLDSSGSGDPDGAVTRAWDLDGDGQYDDSTAASPTVSFAAAGDHAIGLQVTDSDGAQAVATHSVHVDAPPPSSPPPPPPPPVGGTGSGSGPARDISPPSIGLRLPRSRISRVVAKGVRLRVTCSESCRLTARLQLPARTARRLHLSRRSRSFTVGHRTTRLSPRTRRTLVVRLTRRARRALRHQRSVTVKLVVTATDAAGNTRHRTRTLRLKR